MTFSRLFSLRLVRLFLLGLFLVLLAVNWQFHQPDNGEYYRYRAVMPELDKHRRGFIEQLAEADGSFYGRGALYVLLTSLLGWGAFRQLFEKSRAPGLIKLMAGFIPGYLAFIFLNRFWSFFLGPQFGIGVIGLCSLALVGWMVKGWIKGVTIASKPRFFLSQLAALGLLSLLLLFWVVVQFKPVPQHLLVGDSTFYDLQFFLTDWLKNKTADWVLPLTPKHYDELFYLYPLLFTKFASDIPVAAYFYLNVFGKLAACCLIWCLFSIKYRASLITLLLTLLLVAGTLNLNPTVFLTLFDGENPLLVTLHLGRVIAYLVVWVLFVFFQEWEFDQSTGLERVAILLVAAGLPSLSIHVFLFAFPFLCVWPILAYLKKNKAFGFAWMALLGLQVLSFLLSGMQILQLGFGYLGAFGLGLVFLVFQGGLLLWQGKASHLHHLVGLIREPKVRFYGSVLLVCLAASLTLGNVLTQKLLHSLKIEVSQFATKADTAPEMEIFKQVRCDFAYDCQNSFYFIDKFGILLFFILASSVIILVSRATEPPEKRRRLWFFMAGNIYWLAFLGWGQFLAKFVDYPYAWLVGTRFVEIPYFALLLWNLWNLPQLIEPKKKVGTVIFLLIWVFIPLFHMERVKQFEFNAKFILEYFFDYSFDNFSDSDMQKEGTEDWKPDPAPANYAELAKVNLDSLGQRALLVHFLPDKDVFGQKVELIPGKRYRLSITYKTLGSKKIFMSVRHIDMNFGTARDTQLNQFAPPSDFNFTTASMEFTAQVADNYIGFALYDGSLLVKEIQLSRVFDPRPGGSP